MPLVMAAVPVVSPTAFEPTKQCTTMVFCSSVWSSPKGPNWEMGIFAASTVWLLIAAAVVAFASPTRRPLSDWDRYAKDISISAAELVRHGNFDALSKDQYSTLSTSLLDTIARLASSISGADNTTVHASLMVAVPPGDPGVGDSVKFLHHERPITTYRAVLIVDVYSKGVSLEHIRLPVDADLRRVLPGAPLAYTDGAMSIDDTLDIDWDQHAGIDEMLRGDITTYFEAHRKTLRNLICIPLKRGSNVLGVLNIAASHPRQFLESADHISEIVAPYIALLLPLVDHRMKKGYTFPT